MSYRNGKQPTHSPIAIVGMASIFPQAASLREYWDNILNKVDAIIDVPDTHWAVEDYYDPDPQVPDKTYSKRGGFIPEIDFDPLEYGLPPNILEVTDTSQLLSLVVAKDALMDAGYLDAADAIRERTGVVLGVGGGQKLISALSGRLQYPIWEKVLKASGVPDDQVQMLIEKIKKAYIRWEENSFPGMLGNVISGRIANRFDLGGINTVTDSACASSLSALNLAVNELLLGHSDMMLAGGVDTDNSIFMYMCFSKTPAFSHGDHCRPFDTKSDGMMVGEGIGMVVLKRLADAERDGDQIYAVIKGVGTSSDGRFKSIYAPRGEGQERALRRAYERAGVEPDSISLVEAHGTGTVAGDITESQTLVRFMSQVTDRQKSIALGSVKSQIGHTKAAAGVAGLIKVALALHQKVLPPMINVDEPNPKLNLDGSPFYINTEPRPWVPLDDHTPRRAAVSAFGFGGTNFHAVLEEYTGEQKSKKYRLRSTPQLVMLSADTPTELQTLMQEHLANVQDDDPQQAAYHFNELVRSVSDPAPEAARVAFIARTVAEAAERLQTALTMLTRNPQADELQHPKGIYYRQSGLDLKGRVVALFAGQGSQYVNMGRDLALNFPPMQEALRQMDVLFARDGAETLLSKIVYPLPGDDEAAQEDFLRCTENAQPAIGAMSAGLYRLLQKAGFTADFAAGHSFGELTALWAAGVLNDDDYYALVRARGQAMTPQSIPGFDAGSMLAVTGNLVGFEQAVAAYPDVVIANLNSPKQVVLAGPCPALDAAQHGLKAQGYKVVPLPVSAAFHTALVGHAQRPFAAAIQRATFHAPTIPVYSNETAAAYPSDPAAIQQQFTNHLLQSVRFQTEIENIYAAGGYLFVEFGPRNVLTNLVKDTLGDKPHKAVALNPSRQQDSDEQLRDAIAQLCVLGLPLTQFDPYADIPAPTAPKRKGLSVKLVGANYVSDKTRAAFDEALHDDFRVMLPNAAPAKTEAPLVTEPTITPVETVAAAADPSVSPVNSVSQPTGPAPLEVLERSLAQFEAQQGAMLATHNQYLTNQTEYFRLFQQLTQQQQMLIAAGSLTPEAAENMTRSLVMLHDHQAETLRIHERYLSQQSEGLQSFMQLIRDQYLALMGNVEASVLPGPEVPVPAAETVPAPAVPPPAPVISPVLAVTPAPQNVAPVAAPPVVEIEVAPPATNGSGPSMEALAQGLLTVVSDKTGYPADVLELSMDMEADLGIDSIKRVEILGTMRELFPDLPQFNAEDLAELRTLQQIVDYMRAQAGGNAVMTPQPVTPEPVVAQPSVSATAPVLQSTNGSGPSMEALAQGLLTVVSDKTGYPTDVLELSMDMEADLGIDSIKRVEILGAMRELFPDLPQFNAEDLAELRTLQQIVDYMRAQAGGNAVASPQAVTPEPVVVAPSVPAAVPVLQSTNGSGPSIEALAEGLLTVVSDKTGYPTDVLELSMDMEADLGIDSIKRVEILGAMRDLFPALPQFNAEDLAELRTLQQIVDYMRTQSGGSAVTTPQPVTSEPAAAAPSAPVAVPVAPAPNGSGPSMEALAEGLLTVVSDKTGYPADVLELSMDMEADLGIDSIKRVEILGAMRDLFPALPQFNAEDLAELRTLQQIVDYMRVQAAGPEVQPSPFFSAAGELAPHDIPRSTVAVHYLPRPDWLEFEVIPGAVCLLTDDGSPLTAELAHALSAQGWRVVVLSFPTSLFAVSNTLDVPRITLPDLSEDQFKAAVDQITRDHGPIRAFIHLNPTHRLFTKNGNLFLQQEKSILKAVFLLAKHLKAPLTDPTMWTSFMTVARLDGTCGVDMQAPFSAIAGGLFGLTKSLNLEWETVHCRALDVAQTITPSDAARYILAELHDPNRKIVEVGYGLAGRVTLVAQSADLIAL